MKGQQEYEVDIRNNKVKQGFLVKRSRILKQWKQRWMVLTKTHLYSFVQKQVYKKPTQKIPLKQVSTIKSYYKNQYHRPQVIRVESADTDFYLSAKNHQQKWAWMTAIQKMAVIEVCPQQQGTDTQNMIRETIRMSSAIRKTIILKIEKKESYNSQIPKDLFKKLNLALKMNVTQVTILPTLPKIDQSVSQNYSSSKSHRDNKFSQDIQQSKQPQRELQKQVVIKEVYKVVQKIVYVPQIRQKIVYVPQVKQVVKAVSVQQSRQSEKSQKMITVKDRESVNRCQSDILGFFQGIMQVKCQNPRPLIQFMVFLIFSQPQRYTELVLKFSTRQSIQHAFSNAFLQVMNQQIQQQKLNSYLKFISILYQNNEEYFYQNDLKLLIQILLRQMEMNRSYFNQYLIIQVFSAMAEKSWFNQMRHRRDELRQTMLDIRAWTNDTDCRFAVEDLLSKL